MNYRKFNLKASTIKDSINPHDFYMREQGLCRLGARSGQWGVAGLCPFHDDRRAGSFQINIVSGAFKCWSCAASGGDVIAFVMQKYNLSFREALEWLVRAGGVL